jgi:hypothetical protein
MLVSSNCFQKRKKSYANKSKEKEKKSVNLDQNQKREKEMRIHFIISTTIGFFLGQSKKKLAENATLEAENKKLKDQLKANESVLTKSKVGEVNKQSNKPSSK